jgi:transposase
MYTLKAPVSEPVVRFETEPGKQTQVDWAKFRTGDRLSAFVATLGYSRTSYVEFVTDEKLDTLINCHSNAFKYFGGVSHEALYDNMKTVIIERNSYGPGQHKFQVKFWDYAKHMGFCPKVCKPYRAQTKGKVERFIHYLKHSFYYPLQGKLKALGLTLDKETANYYVMKWLDEVANKRLHATTNQVPFTLLTLEQLKLQPLPQDYCNIKIQANTNLIAAESSYFDLSLFDELPMQHELSIYQRLSEQEGASA